MSSAADQAYQYIKETIMSGELKAGDRVKEEIIASAIGISRTPIRAALQQLASQGFITMHHRQSARVAYWNSQEIKEITEVRALLEGYAAGIAAQKMSPEQLDELKQLASQMETAVSHSSSTESEAITELNNQFHMAIINATENTKLAQIIGSLAHPLLVQRQFSSYSKPRLERSMHHHREIIDAISSENSAWAKAIMQSHILASLEHTSN